MQNKAVNWTLAVERMLMLEWWIVKGHKTHKFKAFQEVRTFVIATMNEAGWKHITFISDKFFLIADSAIPVINTSDVTCVLDIKINTPYPAYRKKEKGNYHTTSGTQMIFVNQTLELEDRDVWNFVPDETETIKIRSQDRLKIETSRPWLHPCWSLSTSILQYHGTNKQQCRSAGQFGILLKYPVCI